MRGGEKGEGRTWEEEMRKDYIWKIGQRNRKITGKGKKFGWSIAAGQRNGETNRWEK